MRDAATLHRERRVRKKRSTLGGVSTKESEKVRSREDIGDFRRACAIRRDAVLSLSMSERLARVHVLCKQMSAIKAAARAP